MNTMQEDKRQKNAIYYIDLDSVSLNTFSKGETSGFKGQSTHVKNLKIAADQGHTPSLISLGYCYEDGDGIQKNLTKAFECYESALMLGDISARIELGRCYQYGIGVDKDEARAFRYYSYVARNLNAPQALRATAYYNLIECYMYGSGVKRDVMQGFTCLMRAAELGDPDALKQTKDVIECIETRNSTTSQSQLLTEVRGFSGSPVGGATSTLAPSNEKPEAQSLQKQL